MSNGQKALLDVLDEWHAYWERRAYRTFALWCCENSGVCHVGTVEVEREKPSS